MVLANNCYLLGYLGMPGGWEMVIVLMIALLLFGKRLPEIARNLGRGISEFKGGLHDINSEIQK